MKRVILIVLGMVLFYGLLFCEDGGKLKDFEDELNKPVKHNSDNSHHDDKDDDDEDNFFDVLFRSIVFEIFIGSELPISYYGFQPYTYYEDKGRYIEGGSWFKLEVASEFIYNSSDLNGIGLNADFFFAKAFALKGSCQKFTEKLQNGEDEMVVNDLFIDYYRARLPEFNWYWGVGMKQLSGKNDYAGFAINTGFEIFPVKPFSFDFKANIGWLKEHPVSKIKVNANYHLWHTKLSLGYQNLKTGSAKINSLNAGVAIEF